MLKKITLEKRLMVLWGTAEKVKGVRPHSFFLFAVVLEIDALLQPHSLSFQVQSVFTLCFTLERWVSLVKLTGNRHIHTTCTLRLSVLTHPHKSTSTHKVQESASRNATGAVLPKGIILVSVCFTMSMNHIYIPRCSHLLSIQSLAGTVLSFQPPPWMWGLLSFSFHTASSSQRTG